MNGLFLLTVFQIVALMPPQPSMVTGRLDKFLVTMVHRPYVT